MFLLLWLQTIPSQTALSGANPISRRIAELSGCVGVCAHERTASSQWEQATLPTASPASPALQGPRKRSRQVLGETPSRKPSPYLGSPRARGLVRAALLLTAGSQRRACLLTRREGKSWEAETPQDWSASSLSSSSPGTALLAPTQNSKGDRGQIIPKIRIRQRCCFTLQR